jgi:O-succinylhomoserine sulfhydrylase
MSLQIDDIGLQEWDIDTLAIRAGQLRTDEGAHAEPIFATSSFVFQSAAHAAARFSDAEPGNIYSRFSNPTVRAFEQRLAALERGERCVATASGMAAILSTVMALLSSGDEVVCSRSIFGATQTLFDKHLSRFGIRFRYVDMTDYDAWQAALTEHTRLLFVESPSNPLGDVVDLKRLAAIAHSAGALFVVDNCFLTPALQQPISLGADIVVHSATKYLDGQGRCIGGAIVGRADLLEKIFGFVRSAGPSLSPFNAWVFLKGLETLSLRLRAHSENALALAHWLTGQAAVEQVYYAGLPEHPGHELARRQQTGFGGVLAFQVRGGRDAAWQVIDQTRLHSITANLGDTKSTITHPATTTHSKVSAADRERAGITEGLIRLSVGLESLEDLKADLYRGLMLL